MAGTEGRRTRHDLYLEISRELKDDEVGDIRTFIGGQKVLPAGVIQRATAQEIFNKLERKGVLKRGELSFLVKLMKSIDREDYAEKAIEIEKQEREALENNLPSPSSPLSPTSPTGKQRSFEFKWRNHEQKPYSRPTIAQPAGSVEDLEDLITRNRVLLTKMLRVSDLFPHLIQRGLLQIHEKEDIISRTTDQGKAEALLDLLSQQGKCTSDVFKEILLLGNHEHVLEKIK